MRSPKMTELMSGDYAVTGKLLSDVGLDVGMAYGRAVRISLTGDLMQVRRQAIRGVGRFIPAPLQLHRSARTISKRQNWHSHQARGQPTAGTRGWQPAFAAQPVRQLGLLRGHALRADSGAPCARS